MLQVDRMRDIILSVIPEVVGVVVFFFFQAEDGIRDYKVTGVQTCALPICMNPNTLDHSAPSLFKRRPSRVSQLARSEEHTSELQSPCNLVCRLLLEKKKQQRLGHEPHRLLMHRDYIDRLATHLGHHHPDAL